MHVENHHSFVFFQTYSYITKILELKNLTTQN